MKYCYPGICTGQIHSEEMLITTWISDVSDEMKREILRVIAIFGVPLLDTNKTLGEKLYENYRRVK